MAKSIKAEALKITGAFILDLPKQADERGSFSRLFCQKTLKESGVLHTITQINLSQNSHKNTLRGLHYQKEPHQEFKYVYCLSGKIFDVMVDLRQDSATYGQYESIILSGAEPRALFIPAGCAHGFQTLEDNSNLLYLMGANYLPEAASGIHWKSSDLNIPWPLQNPLVSDQDQKWPDFTAKAVI
ncbi:MAG: dTDP-4-dehydrorhamnose 3,5-epimerase [Gammaproteobacteria bacterium]